MIEDDIEKKMTLKMKFELLARFFYYIEQNLCYFVSHRYIQENKADDLLNSLINENDEDYIKAIKDYMFTTGG